LKTHHDDDRFGDVMGAFVGNASKKVEQLEGSIKQFRTKYEDCATFYGVNPKEMESEEFFGILATFLPSLQEAREENAKAKEVKRKEKERQKEVDRHIASAVCCEC